MMKKSFISFILIITLAIMSPPYNANAREATSKAQCYPQGVIKLKYDMQKHWIEQAWWTRSLIVSNISGLEDQHKVLERLLQNQVDIGNDIKPYYGEEAGNKLTELLKEHILIAGKLIESAKKNDQASLDKLNKEWVRNTDEIVIFLTSANPNWSKKELTDMLYTHLKLTSDEVIARINKDWDGDIRIADLNENHLIKMAELLTDGIVKQFPNKFKM